VQSQLKFLPEFHTDFFFASLAEELGLVGVIFILSLYLVLFWQLLSMGRAPSNFTWITTIGFTAALFFQMAVHMGMNIKLFPITGIPLPLLSSGGSSFLATCIGLGVLARLADLKESIN
jgi:cell division protein FtsW (lipid II flippase)